MKSLKRIVRVLGLLAIAVTGIATSEAQTPPVRILPLGDSLTAGTSNFTVPGAYRNRLYSILTTAGYNVDFIGTNNDSNNPSLPDRNHQGTGGMRIDDIQGGIAGWLNSVEDPDVVLLLAGTNDFSQSFNLGSVQTRMSNLIADIATKRPFAKIIVASLPLRTDDSGKNSQQLGFNAALPGIVNSQVTLGRQVSFVDLAPVLVAGDLTDGVHPNQAGYNKLGDAWLPAITSVISPLGSANPPAVVRTGPPVDLQSITIKFSKPLSDLSANPANFSVNGGVTVSQAVLDAPTKRTITLTTSPQTPGTLYTLAITGVRDRTAQQNLIAPGTTAAYSTDAQTNGSFEADLVGWTATGNIEIKDAAPYAPTNGVKLVAFNAGQTSPGGVLSQTFSTTVGVQYVLAFDAGALGATTEQRMQITVAGATNLVSQQVAISGPGGAGSNWTSRSYGFIANSTTTTMSFSDISSGTNSVDLILDNVRLTTQVPRTLTVSSSPSNGIPMTLSPADLNGAGGAPTGFSRQYSNGTTVTLSAPTLAGSNAFTKWQRNGADLTTNTSTTITMDADYTFNAVYSPSNQVIVNGSFENNYANWTQTGNQEIRVGAPYTTTDGSKIVAFNTGNLPGNGTLAQTFATTPGEVYTLNFDAGVFSFNNSPQTMQVTVVGSGNLLNQNITITGLGGGTTRWVPQSFTFVANSASATLTFRDISSTSSGLDMTLDNVRVTGPALPPNNSPVAVNDSYSTSQDVALVIPATGVLGNDTDAESNPLTAAVDVNPTNGTLVLNSDGSFTYTPNPGYSGPDSFTYRANDGTSDSAIATVSITVNAAVVGSLVNGGFEAGETGWTFSGNYVVFDNSAPYIAFAGNKMLIYNAANGTPNAVASQTFTTAPGQTYELKFQLGIFGSGNVEQKMGIAIDGNASLASTTESLFGNSPDVVWSAKSIIFTADSASTTVSFTDLSPTSIGADLLIDAISVAAYVPNEVPVAVADSYSGNLNSPLVVAAPGVLANDTDADSDPLTAVVDVLPTNGTLSLNANGGFTYTPNTGYVGADSFTYHATDGEDDSNIVTVSLSVGISQLIVNGSFENGDTGWTMTGNRVVYESDGTYVAFQGTKMTIFNAGGSTPNAVVSQAFATVPGETYTLEFNMGILALNTAEQTLRIDVSGTSTPFSVSETLVGNSSGTSIWSPKSYTFVASGASSTLTFTDISTSTDLVDLLLDNVRVTGAAGAPNTPPVAVADSYATNQDTALVVPASGVLANDTDAESNPLAATVSVSPTNGSLSLATDGGFTYTPNSGYTGPDSFTYVANDGLANSNTVTVSITVTPVVSGALVNGSFELGYTGWTQTGNQSIQTGSPYTATEGTRLVSFNDGNRAPNGVLSQAFGTVPGQTYTLAFDAGVFSFNTSPQTLQVTVDGGASLLTQSVTINGLSGGSNRWVPQSFTFVADSGSATLTFRDQSADGNGLDLLLDNVRVTGPPVGNVAPVATADTYSTGIDVPLVVPAAGVLTNDTDVNPSTTLTAELVLSTTNGVLVLDPNGSFTYTPATGYSGPDSFTYRANDGALNSNTVTVSISVSQPISQILVNGSFESDFNGWTNTGNQTIQPTSSFYAPTDGGKLVAFNSVNSTPNGVLSQAFATVPGQTYTLAFDAGVLSFNNFPQTLRVTVDGSSNVLTQVITINGFTDGSNRWFPQSFTFVANSGVSTLTFRDQSTSTNGLDLLLDNVSVTGPPGVPNTAPVAVDESYTTFQGTPLVIAAPGVLANDTDAETNPLTAVVVATPTNGTLSLASDGGFTYTPAANYSGPDSFTYRANDGVTNSNIATVSLTVTPVSIGGLTNGSFENGETGWTMTGNRIVFEEDASYDAFDGTKLLVMNAANSTPDAVISQSFATTPGQDYTLSLRVGILAANLDEQKLEVSVNGVASHVSVTESLFGNNQANTVWSAKSYAFTADSTVTTLTLKDLSVATLGVDLLLDDVKVIAVVPNAPPVANNNSYSTNQDTPLVVPAAGVLTNDTDPETDPLTAQIETAPANGNVILDSDGSFIYTPNPRYSGPDSFTYVANDGTSDSNIATVSINVAAYEILVNGSFESGESGWTMTGNRAVVENDGNFVAAEGTRLLAFNAGNSTPDAVITQSFTTIPGENYTLDFSMGTLGGDGVEQKLLVSLTGTASLASQTETVVGTNSSTTSWTLKSIAFTADSTTTTVSFTDTSLETNLIDLVLDNVTITGPSVGVPNTAPVAVADTYSAVIDTPLVIADPGVLANDTDAELSPLTALIGTLPTNGTVSLSGNGGFTYTPAGGYSGPDSFTYYVNDGVLDSNIVTVSINVTSGFSGLVNGSFESDFNGWTAAGNLGIESGAPYTPTQGSKLAGFNGGNQTPNGVLSQTFATVIGESYTLAFDLGVLSYNTNSQTMRVTVAGSSNVLTQVISINGLGGGSNRWLPQSFTFVANSTASTLTFSDQSSTTNLLDLILDNVRVTANVPGPNTAPEAVADAYAATVDTPLVVPAAGVLINDTDAQANPLTAAINTQPANGTVVLSANGGFTYTPNTGYTGADSFTYRANDGLLNSNIATVSITVGATGVNGFTNGSFESDFSNWTVTGNIEIQSNAPYQPTNGSKLASFNSGQTTPNGVLSQTFATTPGATYTLAFDAGTLAFNTSQQRMQVGVTGAGSLLSQSITLLSTNGTTRWSAQSFSFTANSATTTVSFTDTSVTGTGLDMVLDNIRVTFNAAAPVLRTLTVNATPVSAAITVTPNDSSGNGNGTTNFGRAYAPNTVVSLTAPASSSGVAFLKWQKNGVDLTTNTATTVTMDANHTLTAVYSDPPFSNGSFETGTFAPWTTSGGTSNSVKINGELPATNGTKLVEFNSGQSPAGGILTQTFVTTPGVTYNLAFDLGVIAYNTSLQTLQVSVTGNGSLLNQTASIAGINNGTVKWEPKAYSFTANTANTTLTFTDTSVVTNSLDMLLDNVRVTNANARILAVDAVGAGNVAMTVSPADNNAAGNGTTQFTRNYNLGTVVSLTAPATAPNGATFVKWVKDGVELAVTPATSVTIAADTNVFAIYSGGTFAPLGPNVIVNGSFEFITGHGETATANNWVEANDSTRIEQPGPGFPEYTTDGFNMLSFSVGGTPNNGQIAQAFNTVPGTTYTLQFDCGANGVPVVNQLLDVNVFGAGGASVLTRRLTLPGGNAVVKWLPQTFTFTANSTSSTLMFSDGSTTGNAIDIFVDNVRVRAGTLPPAVLTINTTPVSGKAITVGTPDLAGQTNGTSNFTRIYNAGATVTLVAPHVGFVKWLKNGQWYATNNTITVSMDTSHVMTVVYTDTPVLGPFQNGSFENEFAGWTWAGGPQTVKVKDGLPTTDGLIVVEFNSANSGLDGSITQTFTTVPGAPYSITFDVGSKAFNNANQTLKVQVTGSSSLVNQNFTVTGAGNGDVAYVNRTVNFTANSGVTTLTFSDQSSTGAGIDLLLDNVILTGPSPALAPEESLTAGFGTGDVGSTSFSTVAPGDFAISMNAVEPGEYTLQRSENLSFWEDIETQEVTAPRALEFRDAPEDPKDKMFYRIRIEKN